MSSGGVHRVSAPRPHRERSGDNHAIVRDGRGFRRGDLFRGRRVYEVQRDASLRATVLHLEDRGIIEFADSYFEDGGVAIVVAPPP